MLGLMLGLLILFAGFFASVILILTSFARSFKEAQAYLIPVMLVSLAPGVVCLMPGIEMTTWMSVTPLVNIVILSRDVVDGRAQSVWVLSTLISTVLYSTVALSIAAKIFGTDAVLYGSEGSWVDLFQRPAKPRPSATLTQAMGCLAFLFPAFLILSGLPTRLTGESIAGHVIGNAVITILLFAVVPLTLASWNHVAWSSGFRLRRSNLACFGAAIILGVSLWPFAIELARWQFSSIEQNGTVQELFRKIAARFDQIPLAAKLIALALIPAACEELFFRGYLMTALRSGMSTPLAVISSSCLFGLFHVVATMSFERFLPTCFLGLILGWVCVQSGSVLPGTLLHITHNSLILIMQTYVNKLTWLGLNSETDLRIPTTWLVSAALLVAMGALIMKWGSPRGVTDRTAHSSIGSASIQEL
jgi:ABC-2 type transport system permease protein/sodium transport system permease protein